MATILTASVFSALMLICDIFILVRPRLSLGKHFIFFLSFMALFFIQIYFSFSPVLLMTLAGTSVLLVKFTGELYSFFYIPLGYILNCVLGNLITFAASIAWNLSVQELNADAFYISLFFICIIAVSCPALYLVRRLLQRYLNGKRGSIRRRNILC